MTWYYPPSGVEVDDESVESVTRIWLTDHEARLDEIESHRFGDPFPAVREGSSRRAHSNLPSIGSRIANSLDCSKRS